MNRLFRFEPFVAGLALAVVCRGRDLLNRMAAHLYSRGHYLAYACGDPVFISRLIDEMDGMLTRIKFREIAIAAIRRNAVSSHATTEPLQYGWAPQTKGGRL